MTELTTMSQGLLAAAGDPGVLKMIWFYVQIFIGFSFIIFVHELGHFAVAKWAGVRVEQFAIGFFREVVGFTRGETRYSFNLLPLGGYVKMLGQEDFEIDASGEIQHGDDPRSFANKPVAHRMAIVSAGVIMNILLAGVLFMIVYMVGKEVQAAKVGTVVADGPAALAGIQTGDVIQSIDGTQIDEFKDISMAVLLAKPGKALDFEIERDGKIRHFLVEPEPNRLLELQQIGITTPLSNLIMGLGPEYDPDNPDHPHVWDRIVRLIGAESFDVTEDNANTMISMLLTDPMAFRGIEVERPIIDKDATANTELRTERRVVSLMPHIVLIPGDAGDESRHLLGLVPLLRVNAVLPGSRAEEAGIEAGDIIVQWGDIANPGPREILNQVLGSTKIDPDHPEQDIPITVLRGPAHEEKQVTLRPKVKTVPITGKRRPPVIGMEYGLYAEDYLRVGGVVAEMAGRPTPAASAGIPVNALIETVNDEPVTRWVELAEKLRVHAGQTVAIGYRTPDGEAATAELAVPQSLRTMLGVGPEASIKAVNGKETVTVELKNPDRSVLAAVGEHPLALWTALAQYVGQTIPITFCPTRVSPSQTREVQITEDLLIPWVSMIGYTVDIEPGAEVTLLRKSNPWEALKVGVRKTYYFIVQVYQVMERMIYSRSLGVESISGPIGIVKIGGQMAEKSWVDLLYFLAIISANLAVINFLPLPIVDGGLMIFLIIEKIKGSPVSVRIQVATQVVGLVLIVSAFVFVTIQDLFR